MHRIKFNEPYISGNETAYIEEVISSGHFSGNGPFAKKCQSFCQEKWNFKKCFFTHSGTGALEMAALLLDIEPGDEVIIPSFTFPSTALAFKRQGAKIVFTDSKGSHPCLQESELESLITPKTKAIVPVHYGGIACNMDAILTVASKYDIAVVEDAANATTPDGISFVTREPAPIMEFSPMVIPSIMFEPIPMVTDEEISQWPAIFTPGCIVHKSEIMV